MAVNFFLYIFLLLLFIKSYESDEYDFLYLKNNNSSICDLKITTENLVIFDRCCLSEEWKIIYEKTTSQNALHVYERVRTTRRVFNIEYVIDSHKNQKDIKFNNITIDTFDKKFYLDSIKISNQFPLTLRKGDNFDIIVEYKDYNLTYVDIVISILMINNIDSKNIELNFGYRKIVTYEFIQKIDLSYLFLIIFFIIYVFLVRLKFLVEENQFIKIHIDEIIQGENAEKIFVVVGIVLTLFLFFIIIKYTYYITFFFSILLSILSVKSFFKYLFKIILPSSSHLENKYIYIKNIKIDYSNIIFYLMSIIILIFWYYITDDFFYFHTLLNNIIFFIIVYFIIHKFNLKNFYIIMIISTFMIAYQLIKIIIDENTVQEDNHNVYYITTRFIIDVPIRFILKDLVASPFEEIYFFSIVDITLIGLVVHYCEATIHLSKIYIMISIYGTIIGLIINMIIFYGFNFSPPMAIIPLILNIIPLIIYSIYQKQFFDFVDLESKESKELKEMVKIQEIQDIPAQIDFLKRGDLNISFNGDKLFEEEKNIDDLKPDFDKDEKDSDSDEEDKKKREKLINNFNDKYTYNKINNEQQEDSEIEGMKQIIDLVGGESKDFKDKHLTPTFPRKKNKKMSLDILKTKNFNQFNKKPDQKKVEMKIFEEKSN